MNLRDKRVLVTGATGGIGRELVASLIEQDAHVLLSGRDHATLQHFANYIDDDLSHTAVFAADLSRPQDRAALCSFAARWRGGIDVLINNAAIAGFNLLQDETAGSIDGALTTNLLAPIDLCRQLVPHLTARPEAHIVNIGSVFGHIGFAANSVYCATKFGLRGFSESLRRELADSNVQVHHFAPRATRTDFNTRAVDAMNAALGNASDDPNDVATAIVRALREDRPERIFGWPEKLFARINAILPRVVDAALRDKLKTVQSYAKDAAAIAPAASPIHAGAVTRRAG